MDRKGDHFLPHSSPLTPCAFAPATQTAVSSRTGPPSLPASAPPRPIPPHSGHTALRPPYGLRHPRKLRRPGTPTSTTPAPPPVPDRFSRSSTEPPPAPQHLLQPTQPLLPPTTPSPLLRPRRPISQPVSFRPLFTVLSSFRHTIFQCFTTLPPLHFPF